MTFVTLLFYVFSLFVTGAAVAVVASRNPVHSVLWLIFAFFNAAGLFVLLGAELLAMLLVIVYVGAVAVLFLFVVMMLNIKTSSLKKGFQAHLPMGLLLAAVLFAEISAVILHPSAKIELSDKKPVQTEIPQGIEPRASGKEKPIAKKQEIKKEEIKKAMEEVNDLPLVETTVEETPENIENIKKPTNAQSIGRVLYTQYILYFQTSGLILLVAMIGAIVLTLRHRDGVRRQKASVQNARRDSIKVVKVETGKGVE